MRILATQYTLNNKAFEIYTSGCSGNPHYCVGCHSPETWDFEQGSYLTEEYFKEKIESKLKDFDTIINNIMIFGGEPLDNSKEDLYFLLEKLSKFNKPMPSLTEESKSIIRICFCSGMSSGTRWKQ